MNQLIKRWRFFCAVVLKIGHITGLVRTSVCPFPIGLQAFDSKSKKTSQKNKVSVNFTHENSLMGVPIFSSKFHMSSGKPNIMSVLG